MQPVSNTSLAIANAAPSAANAAGRSGRVPATEEQQQFSPILRAAIEGPSSNNPPAHSRRTDTGSTPEGLNKPDRQRSGDKKPISPTVPIDLSAFLSAHEFSLQALETKAATSTAGFASDANSSGSANSAVAQDQTFKSQLQDTKFPPVAMIPDIKSAIVIQSPETNDMPLFPTVSSAMSSGIFSASVETVLRTNALPDALKTGWTVGTTTVKLPPEQNQLGGPVTGSNAKLAADSNLKGQKELASILQVANNYVIGEMNGSIGSNIDAAVVASDRKQPTSTAGLATQGGSNSPGDSLSHKNPIPAVPDLLAAIADQSDVVLKLDKLSQQTLDGSFVSGNLQQKSDGSLSPTFSTSPALHSDPGFASLLSSATQHPTATLSAFDQKPVDMVQKQLTAPMLAPSVPAAPPDSSHAQDSSSSGHGKQNAAETTAIPSAMDGTSQFSMNLHNAGGPKIDGVTQPTVNAPTPLVSSNNKPTNPAASLPEPSARSLDTPQQTASMANWNGGHFVTDARLIQTPALSEMRISMRSDQLGSVEVRAHSVGDEMGAAIMVEKRDAHTALAIELPALQQSLTDKHINVGRVVLSQGSLNSTTSDSQASPQQGQHHHPSTNHFAGAYLSNDAQALAVTSSTLSSHSGVIFNSHGRLSVHA